jgi:hypothetical protein
MEKKITIIIDTEKGTQQMLTENLYHIEMIGLLEFYKHDTLVTLHKIANPTPAPPDITDGSGMGL